MWGETWGRIGVLKVISLTGLSSELLKLLIHIDNIGRSSTVFSKVSLTPTFVTITLKLAGLIVSRFELIDPGLMGFSHCVFIPLMISFMHITLAIGSRISCLV